MTLDASAIDRLQMAQAITAASEALANTTDHLVSLPESWKLHDLEFAQAHRRRFRGQLRTELLPCFAGYVASFSEDIKPAVFVDAARMAAVAVLNLGQPGDYPGHADHQATYTAKPSAAYAALLKICSQPHSQKDVAEWMEDWLDLLQAEDAAGEPVPPAQAVAAVRSITLEGVKRAEVTEKSLSSSRSSFEQVTASSSSRLPAWLQVSCAEPYIGLAARSLRVRLGVLTGDTVRLQLRVAQAEKHAEEMALELVSLIKAAVPNGLVITGTWQRSA